jgi:hypothetical protein
MKENITISKTELVQLFKKVYEEGWYGSKDMAEVVAVKAVEDIDSETVKGVFTKELVNEANGYYVNNDRPANDIRGPGRANRTQYHRRPTATSMDKSGLMHGELLEQADAISGLAFNNPVPTPPSTITEGDRQAAVLQYQFQWPDPPSNADVSETVVVDESRLESGELPSADVPDEIRQMTDYVGWHII